MNLVEKQVWGRIIIAVSKKIKEFFVNNDFIYSKKLSILRFIGDFKITLMEGKEHYIKSIHITCIFILETFEYKKSMHVRIKYGVFYGSVGNFSTSSQE